ncbi:MAG: FprA family A-type flavoprotein, partial [Chloroflexi bacterium]|nr:FprA family A-type flavoprotein [Chloroflexota bacterium]
NKLDIKPGIDAVGAIDWDRRLFDALIPLPDGTSYNSYLVRGSEKTALIDTVDPALDYILIDNLDRLKVEQLDYIICNHAEQDHAGSIPVILDLYPEAKVVCTPKCKGMLIDLLHLDESVFITVNDKETLSLGNRTFEFVHAPWVHWPETMLTYLREDKILFSCDFFGSHLAQSALYVQDEGQVYESAKRYFGEIMMPFRVNIQKNLEKLKDYNIEIIAPSHGPLYAKPKFILDAYKSWVYDEPRNVVLLPYVSMHGSTKDMVNYLVEALMERGVDVKQFYLTVADPGKIAIALVDSATLVLATCTVLSGAHPLAANAAFLVNALRPNLKFATIIGSFGWGSRAIEQITGMLTNLKLELIDPVYIKGNPREEDFKALDKLADSIAQKHRERGYK